MTLRERSLLDITLLKQNILYWLAAYRLLNIGPITILKCLEHFKNIESLFKASKSDLQAIGLTLRQQQSILSPPWIAAAADLKWCQQHDCHVLSIDNADYPQLLKQIADPPLVLFVKGDITLLSKPQLAMVGTRNPSIMGKEQAFYFAKQLAAAGLIITSGLASGIDAASHKGALAAQGKTIAVFGTGLASVYPRVNLPLANIIQASGALISEFPPLESPKAKNFPRRNRIISGLSLGVLVVEAALRSGSLVTARFALEQDREVFAIPGSIQNPMARGCHALIKQGATLIEKVEDILEQLGSLFSYVTNNVTNPILTEKLDEKSVRLLKQITYEVTPMDVIILRSGLTASQVSSILLTLELLGCVKSVHGGYVRLVNL